MMKTDPSGLTANISSKKHRILLEERIILLLLPLTYFSAKTGLLPRHVSCDGYFYTRHFTDTF